MQVHPGQEEREEQRSVASLSEKINLQVYNQHFNHSQFLLLSA